MRSCAYCGKELATDEKCDCRMSSARQYNNTSETKTDTKSKDTSEWHKSSYQTGYTKKEKKKFRNIFKKKTRNYTASDFKEAANHVSGFTKSFLRDPVSTVSDPGSLNLLQAILIIVISALGISFSLYMILFRFIQTATEFRLIQQIGTFLPKVLGGTITTGGLIVLYLGILYLTNKFIMRSPISFKDFIIRPVSALTPLMIFSVISAAISIFTVYASCMLLITGIIMWIILTYEALRSEWSYASPNKVMYSITLTFFIFFVVIFNIFRVI